MKTSFPRIRSGRSIFVTLLSIFLLSGCGETLDSVLNPDIPKPAADSAIQVQEDYYEKFYKEQSSKGIIRKGTSDIKALDSLPKDAFGRVNWTSAVVNGYIAPKSSLEPDAVDEQPLKLNIFIEAKVPLMANVMFPHSIHTYWLSCNNCHPKIFIPEAGANPITMDEIFKGQWCGRCHGKVAFDFWPRENCIRCHIVLKGQSLEKERWR